MILIYFRASSGSVLFCDPTQDPTMRDHSSVSFISVLSNDQQEFDYLQFVIFRFLDFMISMQSALIVQFCKLFLVRILLELAFHLYACDPTEAVVSLAHSRAHQLIMLVLFLDANVRIRRKLLHGTKRFLSDYNYS